MNWLYMALISNCILCGCEIYTLKAVRSKRDILKYYTFLQNFLALIVSALFCIYLCAALFFRCEIPEAVKGLRYLATCGLTAAALIFIVFLSANSQNRLRAEDFIRIHPKRANFMLHYFCPAVSLLSFALFERQLQLTASVWTGYAAIPSCAYWIAYIILSAAGLWTEPYDFSSSHVGKKKVISEVAAIILLPVSFVFVSYVVWMIK